MTLVPEPARRLAVVLVLALAAVLLPMVGGADPGGLPAAAQAVAVDGGPEPVAHEPGSAAHDPAASDLVTDLVTDAHPASHARAVALRSPAVGSPGHPGPVLDALLPVPPDAPTAGPPASGAVVVDDPGADPGHGTSTAPRGPPAVV